MAAEPDATPGSGFSAERPKAFVDAVVAIALTLLILPLMESVSEVAGAGEDTLSWLEGHRAQLVSFVLSFVMIAMFWMSHHRLFEAVHRVTSGLLWLLAAWMLTIVWLPVATAVAGRMPDDDVFARVTYIGSLTLTALVSLVVRLYLQRHPSLHAVDVHDLGGGLAVDLSLVLLFSLALAATVLLPGVGYYALFITVLSGVAQKAFAGVLRRRDAG